MGLPTSLIGNALPYRVPSCGFRLSLLYAIFFVSGMSSLICEITWARMLVLVLGNTVAATGMILAAFMGGLALGSYSSGRLLGGRRASLWAYALLEVGIGVYAVGSPHLLHPASHLFLAIATDSPAAPVLQLARLGFAFACLFMPAYLMGATFPAILAGSAAAGSPLTATRTGYLYGVNTLGAAAGAIVAGYVLLPSWGAALTLVGAGGLNLLAASGAVLILALAKRAGGAGAPSPQPSPPSGGRGEGEEGILRHIILASTFLTGFIALSYEVLMTRVVILYFGNELLVFTLVVTAFLIGIGLSALGATILGARLDARRIRSGPALGALSLLAGLCLLAPPVLLVQLSQLEAGWARQTQDLLVGGILLVPACLLGSLLPLAIRAIQELSPPALAVRNAGTLYALNTIGGMLGAGFTNAALVPLLGIQGVLAAFAAACVVAGVLILWALRIPRRRVALATVAMLLLLGALASKPHLLEDLYARKLAAYSGRDPAPAVRLYHEGSVATAIVVDFPWLGFRDMFLNGVEEASTRFGHVQLFKLLGVLPVLLHPSDAPQDGLMIAFGAGIASGATLGSGLVSTLTCADLNPDVEAINDLFRETNGDVFHDPRFRFVADDGRNFLLRSANRYGVIISDSTHPRAYDSWILYTEEFYRTVRKRLLPDGVFAQWIPLSDISVENFRILLNTFRTVFPHATLWNVYGTDQAFLVATPQPFRFDLPRIRGRLSGVSASAQLARYQLDDALRLSGFFVMDAEALARFIGEERRTNTDDLPLNQKHALPQHTPLSAQSFDRYQADLRPFLVGANGSDARATERRQVVARAMHRYFFFRDEEALDEASRIDATDGNVGFHLEQSRAAAAIAAERLRRESPRLLEERDRLLSRAQAGPASLRLAEVSMKLHRVEEAESWALAALTHAPESTEARKILGQVYRLKGDREKARTAYEDILKRDSRDPVAISALIGILVEERQEPGRALELLRSMGPRNEQDFQYHLTLAGAYYSIGDYGSAAGSLLQALAIYPGSTEARYYLAEVYLKTGREDQAIGELERLLKINPYHEQGLKQLRSIATK